MRCANPNKKIHFVCITCEKPASRYKAAVGKSLEFCSRKCMIDCPLRIRLAKYTSPEPDANGCIIWVGGKHAFGYGSLRVGSRKVGAHRIAYELANGPIPDGLIVCHKCDNPPCVNADHLFLGTTRDNMRDALEKGRVARQCGEAHGQAKLTDALVRNLRLRHSQKPVDHQEAADELGVSRETVSMILRRATWKHI